MVSLWPWRRDDSSPASFERALSKVSEQIARSTIRLDASRSRSRRVKALWTLYTSIAYLVYTLILTLVLGVNKWTTAHYAGVVGAPVLIFAVRKLATAFYDWRISSEQAYLDSLVKQREATIERLKAATKYNSTQELLNKYGGSSPKSTPKGKDHRGTSQKPTPSAGEKLQHQTQQPGRTGIAPPPTANIPGRAHPPATPAKSSSASDGGPAAPSPPSVPYAPDEPGFAPNAFGPPLQPFPQAPSFQPQSPHWYDRILDVLLGEDETLPKNRLALVCANCRLVNGQAPPGVRDLDDIGKWRCGGCGAWNGGESEARKVLRAMRQQEERDRNERWEAISRGDEGEVIQPSIEQEEQVMASTNPSNGGKAASKGSKKQKVKPAAEDENENADECESKGSGEGEDVDLDADASPQNGRGHADVDEASVAGNAQEEIETGSATKRVTRSSSKAK